MFERYKRWRNLLGEILAHTHVQKYSFRNKFDRPSSEELFEMFVSIASVEKFYVSEILSKNSSNVTNASIYTLLPKHHCQLAVSVITMFENEDSIDEPISVSFTVENYVKSKWGIWFYIHDGIITRSLSVPFDISDNSHKLRAIHAFSFK